MQLVILSLFVIDDPDVVYMIDSDGAFAVADIFKNFSVTNVTGNTLTGISKVQLDYSVSGLTTSGTVLQAIDISQDPTTMMLVQRM